MSIDKFLENLLNNAVKTPSRYKLLFGYLIDVFLIFFVLNILGVINQIHYSSINLNQIALIYSILCFPIYYFLGYYSTVSRYIDSTFCYYIFWINLIFIAFLYFLNYFLDFFPGDLTIWAFFWFLLSTFSSIIRIILRDTLSSINSISFENSKYPI